MRLTFGKLSLVLLAAVAPAARAAVITFDGADNASTPTGSGNFSTATNWAGDALPAVGSFTGNTIDFPASIPLKALTIDLEASAGAGYLQVTNMTFHDGAYTLSGNNLNVNGANTISATGSAGSPSLVTFNNGFARSAPGAATPAPVDTGASFVATNAGDAITVNGVQYEKNFSVGGAGTVTFVGNLNVDTTANKTRDLNKNDTGALVLGNVAGIGTSVGGFKDGVKVNNGAMYVAPGKVAAFSAQLTVAAAQAGAANAVLAGLGAYDLSGNNKNVVVGTGGKRGTIAPGSLTSPVGTLSVSTGTGKVIFGDATSTGVLDVDVGASADRLAVTGAVDLSSVNDVLALHALTGGFDGATTYTVLSFTAGALGANAFNAVTLDGAPVADPTGAGFVANGNAYKVVYTDTVGGGGTVQLAPVAGVTVPEPAGLGVLAAGGVALLARRRR